MALFCAIVVRSKTSSCSSNFLSSSTRKFLLRCISSDEIPRPRPILGQRKQKFPLEPDAFVDHIEVQLKAGDGGSGHASFHTDRSCVRGGPDGGSGGNGAHVIFQADPQFTSLNHIEKEFAQSTVLQEDIAPEENRFGIRPKKRLLVTAANGGNGLTKNCTGRSAEHLVIPVPVLTQFRDVETGKLLCELKTPDAIFVAARGGAGGHGNTHFKSSLNIAPRQVEVGGEGEEKSYHVELKVMAHAGLVGFPNAGKSSFLRAVSRARPKVAYYPFTTLQPHIGMVLYDDYEQFAVADIPGLIQGSHLERGLGIDFLRHIERCLCLFYVIDLSLSEPWEQLAELQAELEHYKEGISAKPYAILGNKIDLDQSKANLGRLLERTDLPVFAISAKYRIGLEPALDYFRELANEMRPQWERERQEDINVTSSAYIERLKQLALKRRKSTIEYVGKRRRNKKIVLTNVPPNFFHNRKIE